MKFSFNTVGAVSLFLFSIFTVLFQINFVSDNPSMCKLKETQHKGDVVKWRERTEMALYHHLYQPIAPRQYEIQIEKMKIITMELQKRTAKIVKLSASVQKFTQQLKSIR